MSVELHQAKNITVSTSALAHLKKHLEKEMGSGCLLSVKKTGCSGLMYKLEIVHSTPENCRAFSIDDTLTLYVRNQQLPILLGTNIDYVQKNLNFDYQFTNPNALNSCGCGESFNIPPELEEFV